MTDDTPARSTSAPSTPARRGRPRTPGRSRAILDATYAILREDGWDGLRMHDVAERANAGLSTIYRRWPTKEHLVAAALRERAGVVVEPSDDPRRDLRATLGALMDAFGPSEGLIISLLAAARESELLDGAVHHILDELVGPPLRDALTAMPGLPPAVVPTLVDSIVGMILLRSGVYAAPVDLDEFAAEVLELVDALASG